MRRLLSFLVVVPTLAFAQSRGFQNPTRLATASDPAALATGDWNHDGKADLAYIDSASTPSLHVLLGKGDGTFSEVQTLVLPTSSCSYYGSTHECYLQQADVNGDGKPDLVFASTIGAAIIDVLPGNGDGTFGAPLSSTIPLNSSPASPVDFPMALGDYTGDGKIDAIIGDVYGNQLLLLQGDGTGYFHVISYIQTNYDNVQNPTGVYAGDFNHDGKLDVLILGAWFSNSVAQMLYGDGKGNFSKGPQYTASTTTVVGLSQFVDATGDGIPDLIGRLDNDVYVLPGQTDGTFGAAQKIAGVIGFNQNLLGVTDLNGDGIPDLVAQSPAGVSVVPGKGGGAFAAPQNVTAGNTASFLLASADFNGDGIEDLAIGGPGGIEFIYGTASGNVASHGIADTGGAIGSIFSGDFNGDGRSELAVLQPGSSTTSATVRTMLSDNSGTLTQGPSISLSTSSVVPGGVANGAGAIADFDGDGRQDLVLAGSPLEMLYGNADGSFTNVVGNIYGGTPFAADVNKDGKMDIVLENGPYSDLSFNEYFKLSSLVNSGGRTFNEVDTALPVTYFNPSLIAVGDLNGDGYADAVIYDSNEPGLHIFLGNGDGTFRAGVSIPVSFAVIPSTTGLSMTVADIDHDGHNDLVAIAAQSNGVQSTLIVFYGDGTGSFGTPQLLPLSHAFTAGFQLVDIDKDGLLDVVASSGSLIATIPNLGGRNFGGESHWLAGQLLIGLVTADFNGDGYPDLTVANGSGFGSSSNLVTTLLNIPVTAGPNNNPVAGTVTASPAVVSYNQSFTLNATIAAISSGLPAPTGAVQFSVDGKFAGTATLVGGAATYSVPGSFTVTLAPGSHVLAAGYSGDSTFAPGVTSGSLTVLAPDYVTQTTMQATSSAITAGQFVTLTATVAADVAVTSGIVTFYDGTTILGHATVSSGVAVLQTNLFNVGANTITAVYQGYAFPGDTFNKAFAFQSSTSPAFSLSVSVDPTSTSLKASSATIAAGTVLTLTATVSSSNTTPFGAVTFSDGSAALGTVALDRAGTATFSSVSLSQGTHTFVATYAANDPFGSSASTATPVTVHVTTSTLPTAYSYISEVSAGAGDTLQITAQVISSNGAQATGPVTLLEDNQIVAAGVLSDTGQVVFDVPASSATKHSFYVSFSGGSSLAPAASPVLLTTGYTASPDFTLSASQIPAGLIATVDDEISLSLRGTPTWPGPVTMSCGNGVPSGYSCMFSASTLQSDGLTVLRFVPNVAFSKTSLLTISACAIPLVFFFRRRRLPAALGCLLLLAISGCGGSASAPARTVQIVTVQASSGGITHSVQILVR